MKKIKQRLYILQVLTILSLQFSALFLIQNNILAKEVLTIDADSQVQILSDKAYRNSNNNSYEAQGNVIIKLGNNSVYGEKASFSPVGESKILGNVRYVGPTFTLYATELNYNFKTGELNAFNAKLVDENFVILGKSITRNSEGIFKAVDAEYTTCRDCPESWSIQGRDVTIIPNEYIYLKHSFIKVKGVIVLYIPYLVLPIKKERESGVLFPRFGFDLDRGFYFQQPYYHVLSKSSDITIAPTSYGRRALGGEFEYRKIINSESSFNFFNMQSFDKIWLPQKLNDELTGKREQRQFYEANLFYKPNHQFSLYSDIKYLSDLDIQPDYDTYLSERLKGNEHGLNIGSSASLGAFYIGASSRFYNNNFYSNAKGFDHTYVQDIAAVEISHSPYAILENIGPIKRFSFWQNVNFNQFSQNHRDFNSSNIRNLQRIDYTPTLKLDMNLFDIVQLESKATYDYQIYYLPNEYSNRTAKKYGVQYKNSLNIEFEKSFGRAYIDTVVVPPVVEEKKNSKLISEIPKIENSVNKKEIYYSSYKHLMKYELSHYYYDRQKFSGNTSLLNQFNQESSDGRFDERDILRGNDNVLYDSSTRTDIPESNTIEFSFFNSILRKTPRPSSTPYDNFKYQYNNFDITKIFYLNLSQGILLDDSIEEFDKRLTRFASTFGLNFERLSVSASEYYFHQNSNHITALNLTHTFDLFKYQITYVYDSFSIQRRKFQTDFNFYISDMLEIKNGYYYDLEESRVYESYVGALYSPDNDCWKFDLEYRQKDTILNNSKTTDKIISFDFLLNYSSKGFDSLLDLKI